MIDLPAGTYHPVDTPESRRKVAEIELDMRNRAIEESRRIRRERFEAERIVNQLRIYRPLYR